MLHGNIFVSQSLGLLLGIQQGLVEVTGEIELGVGARYLWKSIQGVLGHQGKALAVNAHLFDEL